MTQYNNSNMKLAFSVANNAYIVLFKSEGIRLDGEELFFSKLDDAIDALHRHGLAIDKQHNVILANRVYRPGGSIPLSRYELAAEAGGKIKYTDYPERLTGVHCDCGEGRGEFELLPKEEGQKRYIRCRLCGGHSHL
jgi:hypothetical protein